MYFAPPIDYDKVMKKISYDKVIIVGKLLFRNVYVKSTYPHLKLIAYGFVKFFKKQKGLALAELGNPFTGGNIFG